MKVYTPIEKLNMTIYFQLYGLPYKRRTRLSILSHWSQRREILNSSKDLTPQEIERLLNTYFENWALPDGTPTMFEKAKIRSLGEKFSAQWVIVLGQPELQS